MKERPILFSAPMVRAILDGRKTQTRRVVKLPGGTEFDGLQLATANALYSKHNESTGARKLPCPYGTPGDRLWVRETWRTEAQFDALAPRDLPANALIQHVEEEPRRVAFWGKTRPAIHMIRRASRITLEVTGVRVERLHDISEADAKAEGADRDFSPCNPEDREDPREVGYSSASDVALHEATAHRRFFRSLWESINGADSWAANPWVWVVEFKRAHEVSRG